MLYNRIIDLLNNNTIRWKIYLLFFLIVCSVIFFELWEDFRDNSNNLSVYNPVFSKNGGFIYFDGLQKGESAIYRVKIDGSQLKKITTPFGVYDSSPTFSKHWDKILFVTAEQKDSCLDLYLMYPDGTNIRPLTRNGMGGFDPVFSNDGLMVFFVSSCPHGNNEPSEHADIYSINIDGTNRKRVTRLNDFFIRHLSISPDGKKLLFQRESFDTSPSTDSIWIYSLEPQKANPLRPDVSSYLVDNKNKSWATEPMNYGNFYYPQYSPDGNSILFVWPGHYQGHFGHEIYIMDIETKKAKRITDLKEFIVHPSFSPDGKRIVFTVGEKYKNMKPTHFSLWVVNFDGSDPHKIM